MRWGTDDCRTHPSLSLPSGRDYMAANLSVNLYTVNEPWLYSILWCTGVPSVTSDSSHVLRKVPFPIWLMVSTEHSKVPWTPGSREHHGEGLEVVHCIRITRGFFQGCSGSVCHWPWVFSPSVCLRWRRINAQNLLSALSQCSIWGPHLTQPTFLYSFSVKTSFQTCWASTRVAVLSGFNTKWGKILPLATPFPY